MVVNLNMASDQEGSINDYLCDTMASVFRRVYTADVPGNTNREVFCTNSDDLPAVFEASRAQLEQEDYAEIMDNVSADLVEYQAGDLILTDDKAPVELLGMQVLDEIIADELAYYKGAVYQWGTGSGGNAGITETRNGTALGPSRFAAIQAWILRCGAFPPACHF